MKTQLEIQRAHDLLAGIFVGEIPFRFTPAAEKPMHAALDVLCWVLGHDHNEAFGENLRKLEEDIRARGFVLENQGN